MPTTLAFRFPLGRYHANPWDRAVNEGASEWPPSPWRVLRALVATWYTRWPDLPAADLHSVLDVLADTPCYYTPAAKPGHTRHYLPDLDHRRAESGNTSLTLDPFLVIDKDAELLVRWESDLDPAQRESLAKLAELIPYLGRAEAVCQARLVEPGGDREPDGSWWRPGSSGTATTRLLAPVRPLRREILEVTTTDVRKAKHTVPAATRWVDYTCDMADAKTTQRPFPHPNLREPTAVRFAVVGRAPLQLTNGILIADEAHRVAGKLLEKARISDDRRRTVMGTGGAATGHMHAHWVPIGEGTESAGSVRYLIVYAPSGLRSDEIGALLSIGTLSGRRGDDYEVAGFPEQRLLFQAAGQIEDVAPELCASHGGTRWRSVTPYLPVRHRHPNQRTAEEFLTGDVAAELRYRDLPIPVSVAVEEPIAGRVNQFRRYRLGKRERLRDSRPGVGLRLEFDTPLRGPLLLGQLSHFGFGVFVPDL